MKKLTKAISKTTAIFVSAPILALAPSQAELDNYKEVIFNLGAKRLGYTNKDELNE
ncbi:hypothetical protein I3271_00935 [Photobacterium leiognathi]|uniref:hypothetical protein n=1 Tax=Photobacterium leiognathi TaxID=553611 RepID=UPI001EDF4C59|nr:hypothetical protein [Photobacterium leiognathi]MCG3883247.1 hypothetical protein [Photobacterium leiognathi]